MCDIWFNLLPYNTRCVHRMHAAQCPQQPPPSMTSAPRGQLEPANADVLAVSERNHSGNLPEPFPWRFTEAKQKTSALEPWLHTHTHTHTHTFLFMVYGLLRERDSPISLYGSIAKSQHPPPPLSLSILSISRSLLLIHPSSSPSCSLPPLSVV